MRYEIVLVNDGSPDHSWKEIQRLAPAYPHVRALDLMRNYGQHNALLAGIRTARHEVIITLDDDLQNPPDEIPKLLAKLNEGYDVVYGTPLTMQHGLWRNLASRATKLALQSAMGAETAGKVNAFRVFHTQLRDGFAFTLFGLGVLAYVLGRYLVLGHSVPGFPFLSSIIAIFSGAQLFALGIIGEYLARMHFRMMDRPTYAVRDHIGGA